jgi:hypothetical protein
MSTSSASQSGARTVRSWRRPIDRATPLPVPTAALLGGADAGIRPGMHDVPGDSADNLVDLVVDGAGHYLADDRPDVVVSHAMALFEPVL